MQVFNNNLAEPQGISLAVEQNTSSLRKLRPVNLTIDNLCADLRREGGGHLSLFEPATSWLKQCHDTQSLPFSRNLGLFLLPDTHKQPNSHSIPSPPHQLMLFCFNQQQALTRAQKQWLYLHLCSPVWLIHTHAFVSITYINFLP